MFVYIVVDWDEVEARNLHKKAKENATESRQLNVQQRHEHYDLLSLEQGP